MPTPAHLIVDDRREGDLGAWRHAATVAAVLLLLSACGQPVEPRSEPAFPDVAAVVCDGTGVEVLTPRVRPRPDGVHLEITNESGKDMGIGVSYPEGGGRGENAPDTRGTLVFPMPPGPNEVGCTVGDQDPSDPPLKAPIEVVDENGLFVATELQCPDNIAMGFSEDHAVRPDPRRGDVAEIARDDFTGLSPDDAVERAGYPESEEALVRVVREDKVIAVATYLPADDGWVRDSVDSCGDVQ